MAIKISIAFLVFAGIQCSEAKNGEPVNVKITKIEKCLSTNAIPVYVAIKEVNEKVNSITGNGTLPYDITSDIEIKVQLSKQKSDGTWENNMIDIQKNDPCMLLNTIIGEPWWREQDRLKMPRKQCPIKKGTYHDEDLIIDLSGLDIPSFILGTLRAKIQVIKGHDVDMCLLVDVVLS